MKHLIMTILYTNLHPELLLYITYTYLFLSSFWGNKDQIPVLCFGSQGRDPEILPWAQTASLVGHSERLQLKPPYVEKEVLFLRK